MKAVLISIQPKWCELIASGKKIVEVRKTKPKLEVPFKVYIYQTRRTWTYDIYSRIADWQGKVIGEFVCDRFITSFLNNNDGWFVELGCLTTKEIDEYQGENPTLYGWHISDLIIYDKPKELSLFHIVDYEAVRRCEYRERIYNNPDFTNNALLPGGYVCNKGELDWCTKCKTKPLTHPPQSYCYVEGLLLDGF